MKVSLFQGILITVFGLGALFGLFVFATYDGSGGGGEEEVGKVVIWGTLPKQDFSAALVEINRVRVTLKNLSYTEKNPATLPAELATAVATGASPDLILASQEELHALTRFIEPISSELVPPSTYTSAFIDEADIFILADGSGYYGLPFLVDPLILFWNNDVLASAGIAKPPATWEALVGLVPTLAILTPTKQITRGLIALGTYNNIQNARGILSALFLQTRVPISSKSSSGSPKVNLGATAVSGPAPGEAVLGFYTQFADPAKVSYTWNSSLPNSREAFQTGDLALYLGFASEAHTLSALNPNLNFNVAPLPQPGTSLGKVTYGRIYGLMIPRGARNASGAFRAAAALSSATEQKLAAEQTGLAPVSRSVLEDPPANPVAIVAHASALYSKG